MIWDYEVDVVCVGGTIGSLATAIVAVDAGVEVFVTTSRPGRREEPAVLASRTEGGHGWLAADAGDDETNAYFAALAADLDLVSPSAVDLTLPSRVVHELAPAERTARTVEPFRGARLRDWAAQCLASPYGLLYTRLTDWQTTVMRGDDGAPVNVKVVGTMETDPADLSGGLADWLSTQAHLRDIDMVTSSSLQRIVFEDGEVIGAVLDTPDGPCAVRARHGVTVAPGAEALAGGSRLAVPDQAVQVCLVSQTASRFSRIEMLTTEPLPAAARSTCRATNRHLHESLRETRQLRLAAPRCRKMHRYPPLSQ